jgi:2-polyprenyl-3-methyl-5-hydroxy-6-metoxy-1,4-benzoquinol methylase
MCDGTGFTRTFAYREPPAREVRFPSLPAGGYYREVWQCLGCGHFLSTHQMDTALLYTGEYVAATYRDREGIRRTFQRIAALPPERSDNVGRVERLLWFAGQYWARTGHQVPRPTLLDVGAGLGVFPHAVAARGWHCTALDPDPVAVAHLREDLGLAAIGADYLLANDLGRYDVVTFNKVLEHVPDPIAMLRRALANVRPGGFVYVELPDGELSAQEGPEREEFFIDHLHVFSMPSLLHLARRAGFVPLLVERLYEPSTKYTLRAFLQPAE